MEDVDEIEAYARISRRVSIHCDAKRGPNRAQTPLLSSKEQQPDEWSTYGTGIHHATLVIIIIIKNRDATCV